MRAIRRIPPYPFCAIAPLSPSIVACAP
jgi:hypothetical protein